MSESDDGHRGWVNVFANGGIPALIATGAFITEEWEFGLWMFGAAVSVAAADTFASEFGCLDNNVRMITTLKKCCLLYTSPSPRDKRQSRMPSSA